MYVRSVYKYYQVNERTYTDDDDDTDYTFLPPTYNVNVIEIFSPRHYNNSILGILHHIPNKQLDCLHDMVLNENHSPKYVNCTEN